MKSPATLILMAASMLCSGQTIDLGNGIKIIGNVIQFDSTHHQITRCAVPDWSYKPVCLIDGTPFFGHDLDIELPRMQLASLSVSIDGQIVNLEVSGMFNPNGYEPLRPGQFKMKQSDGYNAIDVIGLFSDGAGTYVAVWKVMAGGSIRTLISGSENEVLLWWHEVSYPEPSKR